MTSANAGRTGNFRQAERPHFPVPNSGRTLFSMVFRRPFFVLGGYLLNERLVLGRQVPLFRPVSDVVHLPGAPVGRYQLELVRKGGPVSLVLPEDGAGRTGAGKVVPHSGRRKLSWIGPVGVERTSVHMGGNCQ